MTQTILLTLYALVALVFLDTTFREGATGLRRGWDVMRVVGLVYCLFWPLILLHVIIVAYRDRHARQAGQDRQAGQAPQTRQAAPPVVRPAVPVEIVKPAVRHEKRRLERKRTLDPTQHGR